MSKQIAIDVLPGEGEVKVVVDGVSQYMVTRRDGALYGMQHRCPHAGAMLSIGLIRKIRGEWTVRCPRHGWEFRFSDGLCRKHPIYCLQMYEVKESKGAREPEGYLCVEDRLA